MLTALLLLLSLFWLLLLLRGRHWVQRLLKYWGGLLARHLRVPPCNAVANHVK